MDIHNLDCIFEPQRIALIGITANPKSVSGRVLSNLVSGGFRGVVYPVSPTLEAVMGIPCYANVRSLPRPPDLAVICAPATQVPGIVAECGQAGIFGIIAPGQNLNASFAADGLLPRDRRTMGGQNDDGRDYVR
ncbi:MAG: CoA-binding protein [Candidatus Aminicenantales bacterium]